MNSKPSSRSFERQLSLFSTNDPLLARTEELRKRIHSPYTRKAIDELRASVQLNGAELKFALATEAIKSTEARGKVKEFLTMLGIKAQNSPSSSRTQIDLFQSSIFLQSKSLIAQSEELRKQIRSPRIRKVIDNIRNSFQEYGSYLKFALLTGVIKSVVARREIEKLLVILGIN